MAVEGGVSAEWEGGEGVGGDVAVTRGRRGRQLGKGAGKGRVGWWERKQAGGGTGSVFSSTRTAWYTCTNHVPHSRANHVRHRYGGFITNQLRRLGASCDWSRERFTLDEGLSGEREGGVGGGRCRGEGGTRQGGEGGKGGEEVREGRR